MRAEIRQGRRLENHYSETDDAAVADLETSVDIAAVERDTQELHAVETALARVDTADYGSCADCSSGISYARLLANPAATRCTECQSRRERAGGGTPSL